MSSRSPRSPLHAWQALAGAYLSYVSGIWLALGRDSEQRTVLSRPLSDTGYGGTRYFPLFFTVIALFMRAGVSPLAAGWITSAVAALILATGLFRVARALKLPPDAAVLLGVGGLAPYFVQQTLFEVRADVLAAGLDLWGLSYIVAAWTRDERATTARPDLAALAFVLAFAAKVTSLAVPLSVGVGLVLSGRRREAQVLALWMIAGVALFFAAVELFSSGRAIASWRACMFAGSGAGGTVSALLAGEFVALAGYSHFLTVLLVAVVIAIGSRGDQRAARPRAPGTCGLFGGVFTATALTLSSPGTVPSNQVVEWIEISFVVLAALAVLRPRLRTPVLTVVAGLIVWASAQDVVRVRALWDLRHTRTSAATRLQIVEMVAKANGPVLAESALWPVACGPAAYLLDPFALRVVFDSRPDIYEDLTARLDARAFPMVIFQVDPTTPRGRGYYEHVNFGWPATERILANYRLASHPAGDVYVYVRNERQRARLIVTRYPVRRARARHGRPWRARRGMLPRARLRVSSGGDVRHESSAAAVHRVRLLSTGTCRRADFRLDLAPGRHQARRARPDGRMAVQRPAARGPRAGPRSAASRDRGRWPRCCRTRRDERLRRRSVHRDLAFDTGLEHFDQQHADVRSRAFRHARARRHCRFPAMPAGRRLPTSAPRDPSRRCARDRRDWRRARTGLHHAERCLARDPPACGRTGVSPFDRRGPLR